MAKTATLLEVENLRTWLAGSEGVVRAVDGVSFSLARGETFALLGESGCGKSMTALSIARLLPDSGLIVSGTVKLDGQDVLQLPESAMREVRGSKIGMIFQEPGTSLNPGHDGRRANQRSVDAAYEPAWQRCRRPGSTNCSMRWACPIRQAACSSTRSSFLAA